MPLIENSWSPKPKLEVVDLRGRLRCEISPAADTDAETPGEGILRLLRTFGFRVQGLGVQGSGFRVQGSERRFRV